MQVQKDLAKLGFEPGPVDGQMGRQTKRAVKAFQQAHGLVVDGIPGPMTKNALADQIETLADRKSANDATAAGTGGAGAIGVGALIAFKDDAVSIIDASGEIMERSGFPTELASGVAFLIGVGLFGYFVVWPKIRKNRRAV